MAFARFCSRDSRGIIHSGLCAARVAMHRDLLCMRLAELAFTGETLPETETTF
jgi:hypothetical protein